MKIISSKLVDLCRKIVIGSSLVFGLTILFSKPAHAWFTICNKSSGRVNTAFAYLDNWDNRGTGRATGKWFSEGWWTLNPGQCTQVYPHELWRRNRYYYVYAEEANGNRVWKGSNYFWVTSERFRIHTGQWDIPYNSASGNSVDVSSRGRRVPFIQVDIGGGKTQNFTYNLNN